MTDWTVSMLQAYSDGLKKVKRHEDELTQLCSACGNGAMAAPSPSEVQQIARRLVATREALGLTQAELCRATGLKPNTYNQYEQAKGRPRLDEAKLLCQHLGYTLDWIYRGDISGLPFKIASKMAKPT